MFFVLSGNRPENRQSIEILDKQAAQRPDIDVICCTPKNQGSGWRPLEDDAPLRGFNRVSTFMGICSDVLHEQGQSQKDSQADAWDGIISTYVVTRSHQGPWTLFKGSLTY